MFDLEQSIADWRQQMLDAGIKTPVLMEELESHLREEIEKQLKSGLSELEAFDAGVRNIGLGRALKNEFKKVERDQKGKLTAILPLGWFVAGYILCWSVYSLDYFDIFPFNPGAAGYYFNSTPRPIVGKVTAILAILMTEAAFWFLARAGRGTTSRMFQAFVCCCLAGIAFSTRHDEPYYSLLQNFPKIMKMLELCRPHDFLFQWGQTALLCLPAVFLVWWQWRRVMQERHACLVAE